MNQNPLISSPLSKRWRKIVAGTLASAWLALLVVLTLKDEALPTAGLREWGLVIMFGTVGGVLSFRFGEATFDARISSALRVGFRGVIAALCLAFCYYWFQGSGSLKTRGPEVAFFTTGILPVIFLVGAVWGGDVSERDETLERHVRVKSESIFDPLNPHFS